MLIKIILISIVLLAIALAGFGIKLFFDRNAKLPAGSCQSAQNSDKNFSCGCGGGQCGTGPTVE